MLWLDNDRAEHDFCRLSLAVFVRKARVAFAKKDSAVFVAKPTRDGEEVDSAHHAARRKESAQIVKAEGRQSGSFAGQQQRSSEGAGMSIALASLRRWEQPFRVWCATLRHVLKE